MVFINNIKKKIGCSNLFHANFTLTDIEVIRGRKVIYIRLEFICEYKEVKYSSGCKFIARGD